MKKFILSFVLLFSMLMGINAQVATENAKLLDNTYVSVEVGVATPLDFNSVFPLNTVAGLKLGKELTPIFGIEAEGQVFFNDNNVGRWTDTFVKGTNVGLNGTINLSNLFAGYKGTPRAFEVKTNTGLGWLHYWNTSGNDLTAKTGVDFALNVGKTKAHTFMITPAVYWNLTGNYPIHKVQFNKNYAQLAVFASYVYHFKTSNGTRHFKTYDVGAMMDEINRLNDELAKKPTTVVREVVKTVEAPATATVEVVGDTYVFFAKNSSVLDENAKAVLDKVTGTVDIVASASPEGTTEYNQALSERRAAAVADYLTNRGITVNKQTGVGVTGDTSGRVAIITVK